MAINFTSKKRLESLNKLAEGGEATIYEYDSKRVIKVFKPNVDLDRKKECSPNDRKVIWTVFLFALSRPVT